MQIHWVIQYNEHLSFYKNIPNKNIETELCEKFRVSIKTLKCIHTLFVAGTAHSHRKLQPIFLSKVNKWVETRVGLHSVTHIPHSLDIVFDWEK